MSRIFPNFPTVEPAPDAGDRTTVPAAAETMTVWRKSLLFNCKGFTVFDSKGNLRFRVDNYSARSSSGEIVLMDSSGKPLLTIRRKRLSLGENWLIYDGEEALKPRFSVRKHVTLFGSGEIAHVTPCGLRSHPESSYAVEGSYSRKRCAIYDSRRRAVAEVARKEAAPGVALGGDVFRLGVQPDLEPAFAMAVVVILDQMYGS
ncbi:protein LURP-one-related 8-like [Iris pallida]|uniref:Protein LURP-one-related 8-like n=1 Tax=Iris pallida TaxID=29817 RepID=A0AAX6EL78_IRIPA|nr:protein LURP-one-related 8-like [Iris pallida]